VDGSLGRLGLEYADLFVFHDLSTTDAYDRLCHPGGGFDQLADAVTSAKCRFRGISSHSPDVLRAAIGADLCDVVMFPVGPFVDARYVDEILPLARARGVGTVCFKTFGAGKLLGDTAGYNQRLQLRPRGKLSSGGSDDTESSLPRLRVEECLHYTLTLDPDVALLGLSYPNEQDAAFDAALIPEPTGFATVCAQAGALTFRGTVSGRSTHAAVRLEGCSAIDRYVRVHAALAEHERTVNADVAHPAMRSLALPYPLLVGRVAAGQWSSQVPDRLVFEGRLGVRVEETPEQARAAFERVVAEASNDSEAPVEIQWTGGQFAPAQLAPDHPFTQLVRGAFSAERGADTGIAGVPWGADMRHFRAKGIPCVMAGPPGIELAHAVDERVRVDDLATVARALVRVIVGHPSTVM
jgi:hypothetical protein